eukprot:583622-Amorphochlora_amoeboformis.AAC.2
MPKAPPNAKKAALVIVNAQNDFVEGSVRVEGAEDVLKKINAVKNVTFLSGGMLVNSSMCVYM